MRTPGLFLVGLCLLAALCVADPASGAGELARAWELLERGQRSEANELATVAFTRADSKKERGEALLIQALSTIDGDRARSRLASFLREHRGHALEWRAEYELGLHNYALGTYVQAGRHFARVIELKVGAAEEARARYWLGLSLVGAKNFPEARRHLQLLRANDAGTGLAEAASLSYADCLREEGSYASALVEYLRSTTRLGRSDWLPSALYGAGLCYERLNRLDEARDTYSRLASQFPSSFEAAVVRSKLLSTAKPEVERVEVAGYTVQVGAFSQEANANKLVAALREKGVTESRVTRKERGGRVLFIVHLGEFSTREAAVRKGEELSTRFGLSYTVVAP